MISLEDLFPQKAALLAAVSILKMFLSIPRDNHFCNHESDDRLIMTFLEKRKWNRGPRTTQPIGVAWLIYRYSLLTHFPIPFRFESGIDIYCLRMKFRVQSLNIIRTWWAFLLFTIVSSQDEIQGSVIKYIRTWCAFMLFTIVMSIKYFVCYDPRST